jgi:hypothetical protein
MTGWHGEQWDFQNNEKTMQHSDHWIMTGWHGEQWDFQNNEKTMEHSDHWIRTAWHGEQWDLQNNEKTMEHSDHWFVTGWHCGNVKASCKSSFPTMTSESRNTYVITTKAGHVKREQL